MILPFREGEKSNKYQERYLQSLCDKISNSKTFSFDDFEKEQNSRRVIYFFKTKDLNDYDLLDIYNNYFNKSKTLKNKPIEELIEELSEVDISEIRGVYSALKALKG